MSEARRPGLLTALAFIIFAEAALMVGATAWLLIELIVDVPASMASALALTVLTAIGAVWLVVMGIHTLRASPWVRGGIVVWQVLQIAVAIGCFQGYFARPDIGWALLAPAIVALVLLFTPPVLAVTTRR